MGDLLISSGLGGRFPPGYPVAEVIAWSRIPAILFPTSWRVRGRIWIAAAKCCWSGHRNCRTLTPHRRQRARQPDEHRQTDNAMNLTRHHGGFIILLSFAVAMMLTIIPLSDSVAPAAAGLGGPDTDFLVPGTTLPGQCRLRLYGRPAAGCAYRHTAGRTRPVTESDRLPVRAPAPAHPRLPHVAAVAHRTGPAGHCTSC